MFTNNFKLDGIEDILAEIRYLSEEAKDENDAGEKDGKKEKKSKKEKEDKPKRWWDDDGDGIGYEKGEVKEEAEQLDEISLKTKMSAFKKRATHDFESDGDADNYTKSGENKTDKIKANIVKKHGEKAGQHAERAAHTGIFGRKSFSMPKKPTNEELEVVDEAGKMQGGGKDPCWKGYEMVGMKKKGGREVPNCVPKEEYTELYFDMLEEGYTLDQVREVLAAYEDGYEVIFEEDGVTINETQEILDEEAEFLSDVAMVADWLVAEGIIEDEDEFFELMEDLSEEEIEELYDVVAEATAMAKRGYDETKLRKRAGGGEAADRATALENKPTYGDKNKTAQRQKYARSQRGDFRKTASSNPGLHVGGHKSNDPAVKAKQAARGAQRGALTPKERKDLNMGYEMIGNSLEEGGLEVRNFSWDEVMKEAWKKKAMKKEGYQRTPEKSDKEDRKYEPVRGEKTPMPPRGNKRREDFEKWYAANVR